LASPFYPPPHGLERHMGLVPSGHWAHLTGAVRCFFHSPLPPPFAPPFRQCKNQPPFDIRVFLCDKKAAFSHLFFSPNLRGIINSPFFQKAYSERFSLFVRVVRARFFLFFFSMMLDLFINKTKTSSY